MSTPSDVMSMATEARLPACHTTHPKALERFVEIVAEAERKRLHDEFMAMHKSQQHNNNYWHFAARQIMENTCTPPVAAAPEVFYGFLHGAVSTPNAGGKCVTAGETAPIDPNKWAFDNGLEST